MALTERLAFVVSMNTNAAVKGFQAIGNTAERELARAEQGSRNLQSSLNKFGAVAVGSSLIAGRGLIALANDASDLEETLNKSRVTLGDSSKLVEQFGDTAATALGQSKRDAIEAASSFAALFRTLGQTEEQAAASGIKLTKLASDLASFSNTSPEEAIIALGSALRGEQEPIRRYNVLLNDQVLKQRAATLGLGDFTGTLPPAVRAQAAYAEILAQTSLQQGDFARTSTGAANQQRILSAQIKDLRANIGQGALPALTNLTGGLNTLLGGFSALPDEVQATAGTVLTAATAFTGFAGAGALATSQVLKFKEMLKVTEGATGVFGTSLSKGGAAGIAAAAGLGLLTAGLGAYKAKQAEANAEAEKFAQVLEITGGDLLGSEEGIKALRAEFEPFATDFEAAGISFDTFASALAAIDEPATDASEAFGELQQLARDGAEDTDYYRKRQRELAAEIRAGGGPRNELIAQLIESGLAANISGQAFDSLFDRVDEGDAQYKALIETGALAAEEQAKLTTATGELTEAQSGAIKTAADLAKATDGVTEARQNLLDTTLGLFDSEIDYEQSNLGLLDSLDDVTAAIKAVDDARKTADPQDDIDAQRDLEGAYLDARSGALSMASAAVELAAKQRGLTVDQLGAAEANRIQIAELSRVADTLAPGSPLRVQLEDYITQLKGLDKTFVTELELRVNARLGAGGDFEQENSVLRKYLGAGTTSGLSSTSGMTVNVNVNAGTVVSNPLELARLVKDSVAQLDRVTGSRTVLAS